MNQRPFATCLSLLALTLATTEVAHAANPLDFAPPDSPEPTVVAKTPPPSSPADSVAVSFDLPGTAGKQQGSGEGGEVVGRVSKPKSSDASLPPPSDSSLLPPPSSFSSDDLFAGGSNSLVAKAVGAAEGTRTPDGARTSAYYGHSDPGNGVWNLGSFSYQHEATSPEDADDRQLARLQRQAEQLRQRATVLGLELNLEEKLNGIDLANQAPLAALAEDGGSYVDRLRQAQEMGLRGSEAVLWARVRSFLDPDTGRWNAPGLGNTVDRIAADQQRRMDRIAHAMRVNPLPVKQAQVPQKPPAKPVQPPSSEQVAEQIIFQDLAPPPPSPRDHSPNPAEQRAETILSQPSGELDIPAQPAGEETDPPPLSLELPENPLMSQSPTAKDVPDT